MNLHPWQLTLTVRQRPLKTKKGSRLKISSGIDSGIRSLRRRSVPPVWPKLFIESSLLPHSLVGQVVSRLCPSILQRIQPSLTLHFLRDIRVHSLVPLLRGPRLSSFT